MEKRAPSSLSPPNESEANIQVVSAEPTSGGEGVADLAAASERKLAA